MLTLAMAPFILNFGFLGLQFGYSFWVNQLRRGIHLCIFTGRMKDPWVWSRILRAVAKVSKREESRHHHGRPRSLPEPEPVCPIKSLAWYVPFNKEPQNLQTLCSPQVQWKCPPKFNINPGWRVTAGEESWETKAQLHRETTVLEVVYPHPSAVSMCPSSPLNTESDYSDDAHIPIIPIEETAAAEEAKVQSDASLPSVPRLATVECSEQSSQFFTSVRTTFRTVGNDSICTTRPLPGPAHQVRLIIPSAVRPDDESATTSSIRQQEPFNPYTENPSRDRIRNLIQKYGASNQSPLDRSIHLPDNHLHQWRTNPNPQFHQVSQPDTSFTAMTNAGPPFQSNYEKFPNRHMLETPGQIPLKLEEPGNYAQGLQLGHTKINNKPTAMNPKCRKPCMYFNTTKGCRNCLECLYEHSHVAKRVKFS